MIKKFLFKKLTFLETVSIVLAIMVLLCLLNPESLTFFCMIYALLGASILVLIYIIVCWKKLDNNGRLGSILSIVVWLMLLYGFVRANGLTISSFFTL